MRVIIPIVLLSIACSEEILQPPDSGGSADARPDATATTDSGESDDAAPIDSSVQPDAGESEDAASSMDAEPTDSGESTDAGAPACSTLPRDVCIATPGCVLAGSQTRDPSYFCRDALTPCENIIDPDECTGSPGCTFVSAECYCPEGAQCICGGGPAQVCREICGGIADVQCPTSDFFCDLPQGDGTGPVCLGNFDQQGTCVPFPPSCNNSGGGEVCGCEGAINPTTYTNDCERRRAGASFGAFGACP